MRAIGFALIVIAAAIGALWPWVQLNFFGNKIKDFELDQIQNGRVWQHVIQLSETDNPVRLRLRASYIVDAKLPPLKVPVKVDISDKEGPLLTGILSFPTQGITTGPDQDPVRGSQALKFNVINDGDHALLVSLAPNPNDGGIATPAISSISASVVGNAPELNDDHKALAAIVGLSGLYLIIRFRRKKSARGAQAGKRKWGRGE